MAESSDHTTPTAKAVLKRMVELFEIARDNEVERAKGYILYSGPDKARQFKDLANRDTDEDKREVESTLRRIREYLEYATDGYKLGRYITNEQSQGVWHAYEVFFNQGPDRQVKYFGFLAYQDTYCLGDID